MKKYDIVVELNTTSHFKIEANSLTEAKEEAMTKFIEYELTAEGLEDRTYNIYERIKKEKINDINPQLRRKSQVISTQNKWAQENWNATHNENLKI